MKALLLFTLFVFSVGAAVIFLVEMGSDTDLISTKDINLSIEESEYRRFMIRAKIKLNYWKMRVRKLFNKVTGEAADFSSYENREIVRWQDANGVWHFEYKDAAVETETINDTNAIPGNP